MFDLPISNVSADPLAHVVVPDFLPPDIYRQVCETFPVCEPRGGPSGYSAFWGEPDYDALIATQPAWTAMFQTFQSQAFVDYCFAQFGDVFRTDDCLIDPDKTRFVAFNETREAKRGRHLDGDKPESHDLWVRMDVLQGCVDYDRPVHLDHRRRLLSMLIYFCDADEIAMTGGDLLLHGGDEKKPSTSATAVRPRHNLMAAFPCTPRSWHSVSKITAANARRNFIQVALSSSADAWAR